MIAIACIFIAYTISGICLLTFIEHRHGQFKAARIVRAIAIGFWPILLCMLVYFTIQKLRSA